MGRNFDHEWKTGYWDYMSSLPHVARYGVLASVILSQHPDARILDAGCGEGTLLDFLGGRFESYLGFDVAAEAVRRGRERRGGERVRFEVGSVPTFRADERFDVVVLNAVLYLFENRQEILRNYASMLRPGGSLVVENHTTFRDSRAYFEAVGRLQDTDPLGWSRNAEVQPVSEMSEDFSELLLKAQYTLVNWSVKNSEYPCRHVHVLGRRPVVSEATDPDDLYADLHALSQIGGRTFGRDSTPFVFASESLADVVRVLPVEGRRVLTMLGSGDQYVSFLAAGAREVVGFDISKRACFMTELKLAALRTLGHEEFVDFFLGLQAGPLDEARRAKLEQMLPLMSHSAAAWARFAGSGQEPFHKRVTSPAMLRQMNPWLATAPAYEQARERARRGLLLPADVYRLAEFAPGRFDVVYIGNIPDYYPEAVQPIIERLLPLVEEDGCLVTYQFGAPPAKAPDYGPWVKAQAQGFKGYVWGAADRLWTLTAPRPPPDAPEHEAHALEIGARAAEREQERLDETLARTPVGEPKPLAHGVATAQVFRLDLGERAVVVRLLRASARIGTDAALRSQRAMHRLAHALEAGHLALPVGMMRTPASMRGRTHRADLLAMPAAPAEFVSGSAAGAGARLDKVTEDDRLAAAVLCLLTEQADAVLKNVLVAPDGRLVLLDFDACLRRHCWWGRPNVPVFFPGHRLAWRTAQDGFAQLPSPLRTGVGALARLPWPELGARLGLDDGEARIVSLHARELLDDGLAAAAKRLAKRFGG